jgi:hypothetical protein
MFRISHTKSACRGCGKLIEFGAMIQRMGWYCDDCAGYVKGYSLCECCIRGNTDCISKGGKEPCGYTPKYKVKNGIILEETLL